MTGITLDIILEKLMMHVQKSTVNKILNCFKCLDFYIMPTNP